MSIKSKVLAAAATLTLVGGFGVAGVMTAGTAAAGTPSCGPSCINLFNKDFAGFNGGAASPVDVFRQSVAEHPRVELVSLAVDVDKGAREAGGQERSPEARRGAEELVDKAILRASQRQRVEPRGGEELGRIVGPTMR